MDKKTNNIWNFLANNTDNNDSIDFAGVPIKKSAYYGDPHS